MTLAAGQQMAIYVSGPGQLFPKDYDEASEIEKNIVNISKKSWWLQSDIQEVMQDIKNEINKKGKVHKRIIALYEVLKEVFK